VIGPPPGPLEFAWLRIQALRRAVMAEVEDIHRGISHVLRGGLLVSVGVFVAGLAISALEGTSFPSTTVEPERLLVDLVHLRPQALLTLGVLILILTPVARVAVSVVAVLKAGDRTYAAITAIVLLNLIGAFLLGTV
jgi:uncharacterized membrane protein